MSKMITSSRVASSVAEGPSAMELDVVAIPAHSLPLTVKGLNRRMHVARQRELMWVEEGQQVGPYPRVTISILPDDTLLEVFSFYVEGARRIGYEDKWHTLVHVCRRWRCIVFASPRRLNLQLRCTPNRPAKMLDIWPELPIVVHASTPVKRPRGMANIVCALKKRDRVSEIILEFMPKSLLKKVAAMKKPFPAMKHLILKVYDEKGPVLPLPDSFLGGSAPRLRTLYLHGIPFPALPRLLLSTTDLVYLHLWNINLPHPGYISPEALVTCLSTLTRLQQLGLGFRDPQPRADRATGRPLPPARVVLTTLTKFRYKGNSEYLEDILSRTDAPLLNYTEIKFFNQLVFDIPLLHDFISRTGPLTMLHRAHVTFKNDFVDLVFFTRRGMAGHEAIKLEIWCRVSDWQLSSLAQVCNSFLPLLPTLKHLELHNFITQRYWQDDIENIQWLELLRPFTFVENLVLYGDLIRLLTPALQELVGESVTEVLPALQNLSLRGPKPSGPVQEVIDRFIAARRESGQPVHQEHFPLPLI